MTDEHVKAVIDGLNRVAREMEHWKFREDMDRPRWRTCGGGCSRA